MKHLAALFLSILWISAYCQSSPSGIITGNVLDEKGKALEGVTVQLIHFTDSLAHKSTLTDPNGAFQLNQLAFGYYRLRLSYVGLPSLVLDSIHLRAERYDFNMGDLTLKSSATTEKLEEIIIYAEKPLIQSKDGNITFNAGESALSAGSSASELLTNVPLVTKDPDGKLLVRGKEPKILIDDKPVELNLQQLQDLLESMPGSSVEKIEVMTNPPPQYANEQGGVINIVTRKGTVGKSGRISLNAGSRGEYGINGSYNYRKQGLSYNINAGSGYNNFEGSGYSRRLNKDSTQWNTDNNYRNKSMRPNFRANLTYDLNKYHSFNIVAQYNQNDFTNRNKTVYTNRNKLDQIYRLSERTITSSGESYNPNLSMTYTLRTKKPGETLRLIASYNYAHNNSTRDFFHQYFNPDYTPTGTDSVQQQVTLNNSKGYNLRLSYDLPLNKNKTVVSIGSFYTLNQSHIDAEATYKKRSDGTWAGLDALTNDFLYRQDITNFRGSVKQVWGEQFSTTVGVNAEYTGIRFDLYKTGTDTSNSYWSWLPFATLNRNWKDKLNLTFSYRRTLRRPGIYELNPTIDFSDPYNTRFGNPGLLPSPAHNIDLVLGKSKTGLYTNVGLGYNIVEDIYSTVRTLQPDGKTEITWQNISGRKEYEVSTWNGYTLNKKTRINLSASYTYNVYGAFDKEVRKFRDGGSFTSNLNGNYVVKDLYTATGSFTFNRFANPQGSVRSSLSMNIGFQAKMLQKKLTATLNVIDPFVQQQNRTFTYGPNFTLENYNSTQTRNFRLTLGYNFSATPKRKPAAKKADLQKAIQKAKPK